MSLRMCTNWIDNNCYGSKKLNDSVQETSVAEIA